MNGAPGELIGNTPCWHCRHWGGLLAGGMHGHCRKPGKPAVVASPAYGCVFFEREPGADDDDKTPAGFTGEDRRRRT